MTFDIEKAKQTMEARTKSGELVDIISFNGREPYVIVGYIGDGPIPKTWTKHGRYTEARVSTDDDLINTPVKREGWVVVHPETLTVSGHPAMSERDDAVRYRDATFGQASRWFVAHIEWEE